MIRKSLIGIFTALCLIVSTQISAQVPGVFRVGTIEAFAGSKNSGYLQVPAGIDKGTGIPITLIHGKRTGPVLALVAGTHGYEYPGMSALQSVGQSLDPDTLAGTVILVHIANPPSFRGRTIYYSPVDGKNLNRVYPGNAKGTLSERIAFVITQEIIKRADFLVDLHAGDGNEALMPFVYMPVTGITKLDIAARGMAIAFGLDHIVIDKITLPPPEQSVFTDQTALTLGIPAITTETGQLGYNDEHSIALAEKGIGNLLRHLGMLEGHQRPPGEIVWLYDYEVLKSPNTGFFRASVGPGEIIQADAVVGTVMDDFGNVINVIKSPFAGIVNYVLGTPPVTTDEPMAMISRIQKD